MNEAPITPNLEYLNQVLRERNLTPRQLSKMLFGDGTHRNIIKEITTKPDIRASTVVRLCRVLNISMDSLYQNDIDGLKNQTINGIGIVTNSNHVKIDMADLRAENKTLKLLIAEKDKRIEEMQKHNDQLGRRLDLLIQLGQKKDS